ARAAVASFGDDANGDVTVGHDTEQSVRALLFHDGNDADILALHELSGLADRSARSDTGRIIGHDVADLHRKESGGWTFESRRQRMSSAPSHQRASVVPCITGRLSHSVGVARMAG